jgi:pyridoxine 5-phosphate synthase
MIKLLFNSHSVYTIFLFSKEDGLHLDNKNKNFVIYFELRSTCIIFALNSMQIYRIYFITAKARYNYLIDMTKLSVNINKVATIRNARGGNNPDVLKVALNCESFGADGITVHPRPDERHIRYQDVLDLRPQLSKEFNIEGNPIEKFIALVLKVKPTQVTLVPDSINQITSNHGYDTVKELTFLTDVVGRFNEAGIRTSIFVDADPKMVEYAKKAGAKRVELYTEPYASGYAKDREEVIKPFISAAKAAKEFGLGLNAGHDLSLINLNYFCKMIPWVDEVSIGHAIICDALYMGLKSTIEKYQQSIGNSI